MTLITQDVADGAMRAEWGWPSPNLELPPIWAAAGYPEDLTVRSSSGNFVVIAAVPATQVRSVEVFRVARAAVAVAGPAADLGRISHLAHACAHALHVAPGSPPYVDVCSDLLMPILSAGATGTAWLPAAPGAEAQKWSERETPAWPEVQAAVASASDAGCAVAGQNALLAAILCRSRTIVFGPGLHAAWQCAQAALACLPAEHRALVLRSVQPHATVTALHGMAAGQHPDGELLAGGRNGAVLCCTGTASDVLRIIQPQPGAWDVAIDCSSGKLWIAESSDEAVQAMGRAAEHARAWLALSEARHPVVQALEKGAADQVVSAVLDGVEAVPGRVSSALESWATPSTA